MLVVACNAMSSAGIDHIRAAYPEIPLIEVWEPCARAAVKATRNRRIGVIGTQITIDSRMYELALAATRENVQVYSEVCPRFVEFVERGEITGDEILSLASGYLEPLKQADVDTLILGCTHYPLLEGVIGYVMGHDVVLIEGAREVAIDVFAELTRRDLFAPRGTDPKHRFLSSGDPDLFESLSRKFLGPEIGNVEEFRWS
jgi:glutamate racemase